MIRAHWLGCLMVTLFLGCTAPLETGPSPGSESPYDDSLDDNAPPDEATLCELRWSESSVTDVLNVLGRPDATRDGPSGPTLDYFYDRDAFDDVMLTIFFTDGRFSDAQLSNLAFPQCWTDQISALRRKKLAELDASIETDPE